MYLHLYEKQKWINIIFFLPGEGVREFLFWYCNILSRLSCWEEYQLGKAYQEGMGIVLYLFFPLLWKGGGGYWHCTTNTWILNNVGHQQNWISSPTYPPRIKMMKRILFYIDLSGVGKKFLLWVRPLMNRSRKRKLISIVSYPLQFYMKNNLSI